MRGAGARLARAPCLLYALTDSARGSATRNILVGNTRLHTHRVASRRAGTEMIQLNPRLDKGEAFTEHPPGTAAHCQSRYEVVERSAATGDRIASGIGQKIVLRSDTLASTALMGTMF
jgi:hypothetical protein